MKAGRALSAILTLAVVGAVVVFFAHAFGRNWADVRSYEVRLDVPFLLLSGAALMLNSLLATYGWFSTLSALSPGTPITFSDSVAVVNTNGLLKYLPGRIWPYTLQVYWFARRGFSKTLVTYVYFTNAFASVITFVIIGAGCLVYSPGVPPAASFGLLIASVVTAGAFIGLNARFFNTVLSVVSAISGREIRYIAVPIRLLWHLHGVYLVAAASFGLGAYLLSRAIGFPAEQTMVLPVMSSMLLSDVAGFLAVMIPGGLGVKEGVMYLLLNAGGAGALALILPVAVRIASMITDAMIGAAGFILLQRRRAKEERWSNEHP